MNRLWFAAALVSVGCGGVSFDIPRAGAVQQCMEWVDALEARFVECQYSVDVIVPRVLQLRAFCDRVLYVNPLAKPPSQCIADVAKVDCEKRNGEWCYAFITGG